MLAAVLQWVVSTQLGTNSFFVNNVLGVAECGAHAVMTGPDKSCLDIPCSCRPEGPGGKLTPDVVCEWRGGGQARGRMGE